MVNRVGLDHKWMSVPGRICPEEHERVGSMMEIPGMSKNAYPVVNKKKKNENSQC